MPQCGWTPFVIRMSLSLLITSREVTRDSSSKTGVCEIVPMWSQETKKVVEEAGRKVILIPGDIASEEHIKCVGLSSGNPMVHPAYLCPCMQAWGFDAADCLCMCIRLQFGSDDRGDYVVHELWLEQSTCLCAGTLWQRLWTPLDASTFLSTMLQCRCFSPAKLPALNKSCWAHHAGSRERFSTWQFLMRHNPCIRTSIQESCLHSHNGCNTAILY